MMARGNDCADALMLRQTIASLTMMLRRINKDDDGQNIDGTFGDGDADDGNRHESHIDGSGHVTEVYGHDGEGDNGCHCDLNHY